MHADKVHPKGKGLDLLGQLLGDALFEAYAASGRGEQPAAVARPGGAE